MFTAKVTVDTSKLKTAEVQLQRRAEQVIQKAAMDIEKDAKTRAPVDTGFLRDNINAEQQTPLEWWVIAHAEYSIYQELGTRFMRAHPFLFPALEAARSRFLAAWGKLFQ